MGGAGLGGVGGQYPRLLAGAMEVGDCVHIRQRQSVALVNQLYAESQSNFIETSR